MAYGMGSSNFNTPMGVAGKPKGLFGKMIDRQPYATPGFGDGVIRHTAQERVDHQPAPEPQKPGFLGKGGTGRAIAGTIGDYLMQRQGMDPVYAPTMMMQQQQEAAARQAQLQRAQEMADFEAKEGIKAKYETRKPTSLQQNYEWLLENQPEAAASYLERMTDNSEYRVGPDGRFYRVDKGVPTAPVGKLTPISGGPTQPASGGF